MEAWPHYTGRLITVSTFPLAWPFHWVVRSHYTHKLYSQSFWKKSSALRKSDIFDSKAVKKQLHNPYTPSAYIFCLYTKSLHNKSLILLVSSSSVNATQHTPSCPLTQSMVISDSTTPNTSRPFMFIWFRAIKSYKLLTHVATYIKALS